MVERRALRGQFFILGAILLIILFFIGLPITKPVLNSPSEDLPYISRNVQSEFPRALNLGLNHSSEHHSMGDFTLFFNRTLADHSVRFKALWIYTKNHTTGVNLTIGNYLGSGTTVSLSASSVESELPTSATERVFVHHNGTNTTLLLGTGSPFNLTISFNSVSSTVELLRDKVNLYMFFEINRGEDLVREEFTA